VRRRTLIGGLGTAVIALPARAFAQKLEMPVIGLLSPFTRTETEPWHQAFRQGLRDLGWTEGANARLEYRYADGRSERLPALAAELVALKPDILVVSMTPDAHAALEATKTIPIVMASPGDPVATGLIASLARPGGNVTGLTQISTDLAAKRLQLLKEIAPGISRVAVLWNPPDRISALTWREIQGPAQQLGLTLQSLEVSDADRLDAVFVEAIAAHNHALIALPTPLFVVNAKRIADFALVNRLPSVFHLPEFVQAGGLLSYGPDRADLFRRAAAYVDKILKGAKPGDLPVEQPTKFQLVVNIKTARALGLAIPSTFLARADEVIE